MAVWNVFRILGDLTHLFSKIVLIWSIHSNRSAEGVSLITQVLYAIVFCTRYLDLFYKSWLEAIWNTTFKIFYITSSIYIVYIMLKVFARSREREAAWKFGAACLAGSAVAAPFVMMMFKKNWTFGWTTWTFSEILESVCILPQLILLRETSVPTVIDTFYLLMLGSYRALYILNWIYRAAMEENYSDPISWIFGTIQVLFYLDFAWVYLTRQRVKLRNGTVVDGDDVSRGYLVGKVLGRRSGAADEEAGEDGQASRGWAGRGISVSADEGVTGSRPQPERQPPASSKYKDTAATEEETSSIMRGDQEELDFEDLEDVAETDPPAKTVAPNGVQGGEEWRDEEHH